MLFSDFYASMKSSISTYRAALGVCQAARSQDVLTRRPQGLREQTLQGFYGGPNHKPADQEFCSKCIKHAQKCMNEFIQGDPCLSGTIDAVADDDAIFLVVQQGIEDDIALEMEDEQSQNDDGDDDFE